MPESDTPSPHGEKWDLNLIPDLTGKVALVTGAAATDSIGFNIAHQLALKGAKVYIGARTTEKAEIAINAIISSSPSVSKELLKPFIAELSDLKQVKATSDKFLADESRLDLLIHNAARGPTPMAVDSNGLSLCIVVNHLAPFIITKALLPLLKATAAKSSDVRVVTESFKYDAGGGDDLYPCLYRYGHSKLANVLFAYQLQKRLNEEGVDILSLTLHPGTVKTGMNALAVLSTIAHIFITIAGSVDYVARFGGGNLFDRAFTPLEGAITPLFAAVAPEVRNDKAKFGGAYLMPFGKVSPDDTSEDAKNPALADELWNTSEEVVAELLDW
ncbi:short-chain dehydrogenase [Cyathus striatus]|nr:short-chain dehydrogenase [Cyathus striatus]